MIEERVDQVEERVDHIEGRVDGVEEKLKYWILISDRPENTLIYVFARNWKQQD